MSAVFDPYRKWLGIPLKDQPPHYYRLLGVELFEDDLQVIEVAADRQLSSLRKFQSGEHAQACSQLLNEVARARLCLLKPASKAAYDVKLRIRLEGTSSANLVMTDEVSDQNRSRLILSAVGSGVALIAIIAAFFLFWPKGTPELGQQDGERDNSKQTSGVEVAAGTGVATPQVAHGASPANADGKIDILARLGSKHVVKGSWNIEPNLLEPLTEESHAMVKLPVPIPAEYTLHIEGTHLAHSGPANTTMAVGFVCGGNDCLLAMQVNPQQGGSGLHAIDGREWNQNETTLPELKLPIGEPFKLDLIVRKSNIEARLNGRTIVDWGQGFQRLELTPDFKLTDPQQLFLVAESKYRFTQVNLGPPLPVRKLPGEDLKVGETVELLNFVDLKQDVWSGEWTRDGVAVMSPPDIAQARLSVPYQAPHDYELVADVESEKPNGFYLGLPFQFGHAGVGLGGDDGQNSVLIPESGAHNIPSLLHRGPAFENKRSTIVTTVRKNQLLVKVGNTTIFDWQGDSRRFRGWPGWATPGNRVTIGTSHTSYRIHSLKLTRLADSPDPFPKPPAPQDGDLLAIVNVDRDTSTGAWQNSDRELVSTNVVPSGIRFPATLPASYEFRVIVEIDNSPQGSLLISLPVAGKAVMLQLGSRGGTLSGIEWMDGKRFDQNMTTVRHASRLLPPQTPRVLHGQVSGRHLRIDINDEKLWDLDIPDNLVDPSWEARAGWFTPEERLQMHFMAWYTQAKLHEVRYRPLDSNSPAFPPISLVVVPSGPAGLEPEPSSPHISFGTTKLPPNSVLNDTHLKVRAKLKPKFPRLKPGAEQLAMARMLRQMANDPATDSTEKYICLNEARGLAADAGDWQEAMSLFNAITSEFDVDYVNLQQETLATFFNRIKGRPQNLWFAEESLWLIDQLIENWQPYKAYDHAVIAIEAAAKAEDEWLRSELQRRRDAASDFKEEWKSMLQARATLMTSPEDPEARMVWGNWLCRRKGNWAEALQTFQGVSDPVLKDLAVREMRGPADKDFAALGNDWLAYAKSKPDRSLVIFTERALYWLAVAYAKADVQQRQMLEDPLQKAVSFREGTGDVIALLDDVRRKIEKNQLRKSELTLSAYDSEIQEISAERGILVGLNFSMGRVDGHPVFQAVQPVYLTKYGTQLGEWSRPAEGQLVEVRARPGYAINGLISQSGAYLETLQVTFAQITQTGLDREHRYLSPVINGPRRDTPLKQIPMPGGRPVVGIVHHSDSKVLRGIGCVFAR